MRRTLLSAATLTVAGLTLTQLAPAQADGIGVSDPQDLNHGADLRSVEVTHGSRNVVITTTHADLVESFRSGSSGSVFIDTDDTDPGPEYVFAGGFFVGTDYNLVATDGFGRSDTRASLRRHFHIDPESIAVSVLSELARRGEIGAEVPAKAVAQYDLLAEHQPAEKDTTEGGAE